MTAKRRTSGSYTRTDAQNQKVATTLKQQYASGQRKPAVEAMLAVGWSSERIAKQKATSRERIGTDHWSQTAAGKQRISKIHTGKTISLKQRKAVSDAAKKRLQSENQFSRCKKGKRPDLGGTFFRSSWEANYARILNHQGVRWQYEPETFQVGESETYTPDFKLEDGTLVEIKGWWTESGKRKVNLFQSKYPTMKLEIVTRKEYTALSKTYRNLITNWE